jgi:hypothetical protein
MFQILGGAFGTEEARQSPTLRREESSRATFTLKLRRFAIVRTGHTWFTNDISLWVIDVGSGKGSSRTIDTDSDTIIIRH